MGFVAFKSLYPGRLVPLSFLGVRRPSAGRHSRYTLRFFVPLGETRALVAGAMTCVGWERCFVLSCFPLKLALDKAVLATKSMTLCVFCLELIKSVSAKSGNPLKTKTPAPPSWFRRCCPLAVLEVVCFVEGVIFEVANLWLLLASCS